ncbi:MAG: HD domain-containing protein [Gemmatimonadales bacterium]|nr:HD domain-containing protein [Gemmatimonadales bacterium]
MSGVDESPLIDLLTTVNRLKVTPRTGWAQRGVSNPESVADHSHGVAMVALLLLDLVDGLDRAKVLAMAVAHDLPESVTGDLSLGGSRHLPRGAKAIAEQAAMDELLQGLPFGPAWRARWDEFEALDTPEARLVRDADRIDLLIQALAYERTTGNRELDEFWNFAPLESFHFEISRRIVAGLWKRRET